MSKTEKQELKTFEEFDLCDDCGGRLVSKTDLTKLSKPQRYYNTCEGCGAKTTSLEYSPRIVYERAEK